MKASKTEKQDLLHEGLLELLTFVIKSRDMAHRIKEDEELKLWREDLDSLQTDLNEFITELCNMLGNAAGYKIENSEKQ
jgi:hypothetical protein